MSANVDRKSSLAETLAELRGAVAALSHRIAALESALTEQPPRAPGGDGDAVAAKSQPAPDHITPQLLAVISAVLAAHLGVRPHIRQVTLIGGTAWAQQGRVTVQASHALAIQRD